MSDLIFDPRYRDAIAAGAQWASVAFVRATGKPSRANLTLDGGILRAIDSAAQ